MRGCCGRGSCGPNTRASPGRQSSWGCLLARALFGAEIQVKAGVEVPRPPLSPLTDCDLVVPVPYSGRERPYNVPSLMALPLARAPGDHRRPAGHAADHGGGLPGHPGPRERLLHVRGNFRADAGRVSGQRGAADRRRGHHRLHRRGLCPGPGGMRGPSRWPLLRWRRPAATPHCRRARAALRGRGRAGGGRGTGVLTPSENAKNPWTKPVESGIIMKLRATSPQRYPGVAQFWVARYEWGSRGREFDSRHSTRPPVPGRWTWEPAVFVL